MKKLFWLPCLFCLLLLLPPARAQDFTPLNSWSFQDPDVWDSDNFTAPVSFTNLAFAYLGNGSSLTVDTNLPAWLQFNLVEANGATNLALDTGSVTFWFAPHWSGTNLDGNGPGDFARLLDVGSYTEDASVGWWSLGVDDAGANLFFEAQTNDFSSNTVTFLSVPVAWTTNCFHFIALTYSPTNTALYLDGELVTNGLPLAVYPGGDVLTNGFFIGSDKDGGHQAHGCLDDLATFGEVLDAETVAAMFAEQLHRFQINPNNRMMFGLAANHSLNVAAVTPRIFTGQGNLQPVGAIPCVTNTNIWLTNVTATVAGNGTVNVTFGIAGGQDGLAYDVFANSVLTLASNGVPWSWQGQGQHCQKYSLTNLPVGTVYLILGTPQDTDGDGLTDAYEKLVGKGDTGFVDTDGDGVPDGWEALLGMNAQASDLATPSSRANYIYDPDEWLNQISGIKGGSVTLDAEGNVTQADQ